MDPQIHGAIVGGLIGGSTLGLGVIGSEWLARARERRAAFEDSLARLALAMPKTTAPASVKWSGPRPPKEVWAVGWMEVHELLLRMMRQCRGFRRARSAREALDKLVVRYDVLLDEFFLRGRILTVDDMLEVSTHDLMAAMKRPGQRYLDADVVEYRSRLGPGG